MAGPGVLVTTATRSGPSAFPRAISGQFFVSGVTERGALTPIRVNSMADYGRLCGGRVAYGNLYDSLKTFFEEGGTQAWIARVVGPGAVVSSLTLSDQSATTGLPTLRVDAANPGVWGTSLTVSVVQGNASPSNGTAAGTFRLIVKLNGVVVEDYNNLASPSAAASALTGSPYVNVVDLGSASTSPTNGPRSVTDVPLVGGTDDRVNVTTQMYVDALDRFNTGLGDGAVAIPGQDTAVHAGIDAHCRARRRIGLLAHARGTSVSNLNTAAAVVNSEYCGLFAPWVLVPDGAGGVRAVSPEGYVAAKRNIAHETEGPWRAAAGGIAVGRYIVGVDQTFTRIDGDALDSGRVSPIRIVANTVRLYGWRSLSQDEQNYSLLTGRDVLNRLVTECERRLEDFVFNTIDGKGHLLASINGTLVGVVEPMRQAGGIYELIGADGKQIDPGYNVDTSANVNPITSLALNRVNAVLAVRVSPVGALIALTIVKVGVTGAV